jgi:hypothetical protein
MNDLGCPGAGDVTTMPAANGGQSTVSESLEASHNSLNCPWP